MIFAGAILAIQIACLIHVVRTGRNQIWIGALMFPPVASAIAYFIVEILPGLRHNRHVRTVQAKAVARIDPEREVRATRDALDLADTAANRIRLADAYAELDRHAEAVVLFEEALEKGPADAMTRRKLARSLFETGAAAEALAMIERDEPPSGQGERDRQDLLRARILEALGRKDEALAVYADIVTRLPGEEARVRYAALLLDRGWDNRALRVLEEVEGRMKRLDRQQRAAEAEMYSWAMAKLAGLRAR